MKTIITLNHIKKVLSYFIEAINIFNTSRKGKALLIAKGLLVLSVCLISSCENSDEVTSSNDVKDSYFGSWYSNNIEYVEELTVNSDQEIVDIESNLSGYKEFEGQIIASGNESIAFNYGNPLNMFFMSSGNDQYPNTIILADFNIIDYMLLDEDSIEGAQIQIIGDSAFVIIVEGTGTSAVSRSYFGAVDINWNINIGNENDIENLNYNDNLTIFSFNSPAVLEPYGNDNQASGSITLDGSLSFTTTNLNADTPIDMYQLLYGLSADDFFAVMDPEFFRPADYIKLDIINDQTYQIEGIITEFDYDYNYDYGEMEGYSDTTVCNGEWYFSEDTLIIDLNSETCEDDENQDEDYYYQNEDPYNLIKFTLDANENLIGEQIMNDFCQSSANYYSDYYYYDGESEQDCKENFENYHGLSSGSAVSLNIGVRLHFSRGQTVMLQKTPKLHLPTLKNHFNYLKLHNKKWLNKD